MPITYHGLGLMSGSSLDGLDLAYCRFELQPENDRPVKQWSLLWGKTLPFSDFWRKKLRELPSSSALELAEAHAAFGRFLGEKVGDCLPACDPPPDYIASHGHTLFHYPDRSFTYQLGDGAALAARTGHIVVSDFRAQDMALGGQGAPLAPLADRHLFPGYDLYLNLGGIANLSASLPDGGVVAFDIGGANQVLNALVDPLGMPYDEGGRLAAAGEPNQRLLAKVDGLPYFEAAYPKSLGNDWVRDTLLPIYREAELPLATKLHSACRQLASQVARSILQIRRREALPGGPARMLVTGGGAWNTFLVQCIREACLRHLPVEVIVPEPSVVGYKEAALIALMGAFRLEGLPNGLATVTGASADSCAGAVYRPGPTER